VRLGGKPKWLAAAAAAAAQQLTLLALYS